MSYVFKHILLMGKQITYEKRKEKICSIRCTLDVFQAILLLSVWVCLKYKLKLNEFCLKSKAHINWGCRSYFGLSIYCSSFLLVIVFPLRIFKLAIFSFLWMIWKLSKTWVRMLFMMMKYPLRKIFNKVLKNLVWMMNFHHYICLCCYHGWKYCCFHCIVNLELYVYLWCLDLITLKFGVWGLFM